MSGKRALLLDFIPSPSAGAGAREDERYAQGVNFNLDASSLIAGFVVSGVGFVLFTYGRKMGRAPHFVVGLILMIFPYFVPSVLVMLGIGALLCGLCYMAARAGY